MGGPPKVSVMSILWLLAAMSVPGTTIVQTASILRLPPSR